MRERRACVRFVVPGATVSYRIQGYLFRVFAPSDEGCPVLDLGKGGLSFLTNRVLRAGQKITLLLSFSDSKEPVALEGRIVHAGMNREMSYKYRAGVQFNPFGTGKNANPLEVLKRLDDLEKTYSAVHFPRSGSTKKDALSAGAGRETLFRPVCSCGERA
jgi:Tfp pilus assembly protein PilZ